MARTGNSANPLGKGVAGYYGVRQDVVNEIQGFQQSNENPFASLPQPSPKGLRAKSGAFVEGYSVFNDMTGTVASTSKYDLDAERFGYDVTAGTYYQPPSYNPNDPLTPRYQNQAGLLPGSGQAANRVDGPAPLTVVPTSTSNLKRPRTVAAGWVANPGDEKLGKLTVLFRDGTYYNYYDVSEAEWLRFKTAPSKGPLLNPRPVPGFLMYKSRGEATLDFMSEQAQETQYRIARTTQMIYQTESEARQNIKPLRAGRPPKPNAQRGGSNTAKAGRKKP